MKRIKGRYKFKVVSVVQDEILKIKFPEGSILLGTSYPHYYPETGPVNGKHIAKLFVLIQIKEEEQ